jgi:xylulokinase
MAVFVGCDLGTMGTKAAAVDEDGSILGDAFEEVELRHPRPGLSEQDLDEIEASAHRTIRAAVEASGRGDDVAGVALSSQMSGIGTIDADFRPATHYDSWLDTRCAPYIERMAEHAARVTELSGCPPTYSHGPKIMWWQWERPDDHARIARFVVPGAYVAGRLAGLSVDEAFIDRTYLHFSNLADTRRAQWSEELIDTFGVDADRLPRIVDPIDVIGEVTREASEATGMPVGTPVAAGAGDTAVAALGAAVVEPGRAFDVAGTASVFAVCLDQFAPDVAHQTVMACHSVVPGLFSGMAFINGGGLALRWFRDEVATEYAKDPDAFERLDALAADVEPGAGGLLWLPHVQGRVLPPDPYARGAWVGATAGQGHGHLFRAILEGIAFEYGTWAQAIRQAAGGIDLRETRALGGGARSPLWNSIKADVLGVDWVPMEREDAGMLGDALIAAVATGHVDDLAGGAAAWQQTRQAVEPDPERHERYQGFLDAYRLLSTQLGDVFSALGEAAP